MEESSLRYGGLWIRLAALLLDGVFFFISVMAASLLGSVVLGQVAGSSPRIGIYYVFGAWLVVSIFYHIFLVRQFGGTPGKLICGLRVRKINGAPVGFKEAFARYCPYLTLCLLAGIASIIAVSHVSDADFLSVTPLDWYKRIPENYPDWMVPVQWCQIVWVWGEIMVFCGNWKRRALHDLIGHTVVTYANSENALPPVDFHEEWPPESAS